MNQLQDISNTLIETAAEQLIALESGDTTGYLPLYHTLLQAEKAIKNLKDQCKEGAILEIENGDTLPGYEVKVKNGGTIYRYNHIPQIAALTEQIKELEEQSKQALISQSKGMAVATTDGEDIILPEVSYRSDSLSIIRKR